MSVELRPAFSWDCPDCGRENFCRGIVPEMSPAEMVELRDDHGIESWESGNFVMQPDLVECSHCQEAFNSTHFNDEICD